MLNRLSDALDELMKTSWRSIGDRAIKMPPTRWGIAGPGAIAAKLAPLTPKDALTKTGKGMPYLVPA